MDTTKQLTADIEKMALTLGAFKVGFVTTATLAGGPPFTDLN